MVVDGIAPGVVSATTIVVESEGVVERPTFVNAVVVPGDKLEETVGVKLGEVAEV